MLSNESLLKCQNCHKSYSEHDIPRTLPCLNTICNKCYKTFQLEQKCDACSLEHAISEDLPINKTALSLLRLNANSELDRIKHECNELQKGVKLAIEKHIVEIHDLFESFSNQIKLFQVEDEKLDFKFQKSKRNSFSDGKVGNWNQFIASFIASKNNFNRENILLIFF